VNPFSGFYLENLSETCRRTGMFMAAHSIMSPPLSANEMSLTLYDSILYPCHYHVPALILGSLVPKPRSTVSKQGIKGFMAVSLT